MTRATVAVCLLLGLAAPVAAQPVCRTIVLPDQGDEFKTDVTVPARTLPGIYPVFYLVPPNATSVGLEFWAHRIRSGSFPGIVYPAVPKDYFLIHGYIVNTVTGERNQVMPGASKGPGLDGHWITFAMSTFLHRGEYFTVGLYNGWSKPVTADVIITIRECVTP